MKRLDNGHSASKDSSPEDEISLAELSVDEISDKYPGNSKINKILNEFVILKASNDKVSVIDIIIKNLGELESLEEKDKKNIQQIIKKLETKRSKLEKKESDLEKELKVLKELKTFTFKTKTKDPDLKLYNTAIREAQYIKNAAEKKRLIKVARQFYKEYIDPEFYRFKSRVHESSVRKSRVRNSVIKKRY